MKILFDECVPWPLHTLLIGHDCTTAQKCGWGGIENGELLREAENRFDIFLTSDQGVRYQQNLEGRRIAIIELSTNDLRRLERAVEVVKAAVGTIGPGEFVRLTIP